MFAFAAICLLAGIFPGVVIDLLAPVVHALTGARMPTQLGVAWLSIVPVESARSSYNGLLVFLFIVASAWLTVLVIHRFASRALRRGPAWDCGFPDPRPETQYTGGSFAQPIRRVYGAVVFRTYETVTMPPPGDNSPARIEKHFSNVIWDVFYAPIAGAVWRASEVLNAALVILLLALALWQ
jgi:hydrogenase-4 component B